MQTRNKFFDDMSQLMTNAMGVAQGAKTEAETAMKGLIDRWMADRDFVTREEFDAVRAMATRAREENAALSARIAALEAAIAAWRGPQRLRALFAGLTPPAHLAPINLSIGEPKHPTPPFIIEALARALPGIASYPLTAGQPELRDRLAQPDMAQLAQRVIARGISIAGVRR